MDSIKYDVFKLKSEEVKFNAFFEYLKSFSEAGLDTLQKLENDFHKQMKKKVKEVQKLSLMKNILSSYEIFILEIKDSCDFVEIPQFGFCIGKAFVQLIKIIKWFLRAWLKNSYKYEKVVSKLQTQQANQNEEKEAQPNICAFCEELIKYNPYTKDGRNKRKGLAFNDINCELKNAKKNHYNEMNQIMSFKEHVLQRYTLKEISSKRYISDPADIDILNRKHMAMKLQISDNGNFLQEILNEFNLKTESISRFVANTQAMCMQDFKISNDVDYSRFEEQMKMRIAEKFEEAKQKMKTLVANKIIEFQKIKKSKMVDKQIQVDIKEYPQKERLQQKIKLITASYHKLKNQLESERNLNEGLKKLLQSKSAQFQQQFLNYRKSTILSGDKAKQNLKSLKSFKSILEDKNQDYQDVDQKQYKETFVAQQYEVKQKVTKKYGHTNKDDLFKKNSIKFTFSNQSDFDDEEQDNHRNTTQSPKIDDSETFNQYLIEKAEAQTQTQPFIWEPNTGGVYSSHSTTKKFFILSKDGTFQVQKVKNQKQNSQKKNIKKPAPTISPYARVNSRLHLKTDKKEVKRQKKKASTNLENCLRSFTKDSFRNQKPIVQQIKCYKVNESPQFFKVDKLDFTRADVVNLYVNYKNAHQYECLVYKNTFRKDQKSTQRRVTTYTGKVQTPILDDSFKNDQQEKNLIQNKIVNVLHLQLANFKKKQKNLHEQIKLLLRSPTQIGQNLDVVYLQKLKQPIQKDIDLGELRRMISLIFKYHVNCIGNQKEVVCSHLARFCLRLGISFAELDTQTQCL